MVDDIHACHAQLFKSEPKACHDQLFKSGPNACHNLGHNYTDCYCFDASTTTTTTTTTTYHIFLRTIISRSSSPTAASNRRRYYESMLVAMRLAQEDVFLSTSCHRLAPRQSIPMRALSSGCRSPVHQNSRTDPLLWCCLAALHLYTSRDL